MVSPLLLFVVHRLVEADQNGLFCKAAASEPASRTFSLYVEPLSAVRTKQRAIFIGLKKTKAFIPVVCSGTKA
jgi:hypothetical protein